MIQRGGGMRLSATAQKRYQQQVMSVFRIADRLNSFENLHLQLQFLLEFAMQGRLGHLTVLKFPARKFP